MEQLRFPLLFELERTTSVAYLHPKPHPSHVAHLSLASATAIPRKAQYIGRKTHYPGRFRGRRIAAKTQSGETRRASELELSFSVWELNEQERSRMEGSKRDVT